MIEALVSLVEF